MLINMTKYTNKMFLKIYTSKKETTVKKHG